MLNKVYLCLISILYAVLSQEIVGALLKDDIRESSNVLVREKRVISRNPLEDVPVEKTDYLYIVNIKHNNRIVGVGSILSLRIAITAARAVSLDMQQYIVTSASHYSYLGQLHNITHKEIKLSQPHRRDAGVAMITVNPPFLHKNIRIISLHTEPVPAGAIGTIIGWSSSLYGGARQTQHPRRLRAITVPIMNHRECVANYRSIFAIREDNVCTYHEQKQCGATDVGAPLVMRNELVGIHIGILDTPHSCPLKPDIFILLQDSQFHQWVSSHII